MIANGRKSGCRTRLARKQPRPVGSQVESHVRQTEMHAQTATAIGVRTTGWARADNGAGIRHGEPPAPDGLECGSSRHRVADALSVIRQSTLAGAVARKMAIVCVMSCGVI